MSSLGWCDGGKFAIATNGGFGGEAWLSMRALARQSAASGGAQLEVGNASSWLIAGTQENLARLVAYLPDQRFS